MNQVPLTAIPSQQLTINMDGGTWRLKIYPSIYNMCIDIELNGTELIMGLVCSPGTYLIPYEYLRYPSYGNFLFDSEVDWERFGIDCNLYYLTADEVDQYKAAVNDALEVVYANTTNNA